MRPTIDDLIKLWLYTYSRASLLEAERWIDVLKSSETAITPITRSLSCSIVASYARPFTFSQVTKSKRLVPLKDVHPPHELASSHLMMLKLRDKVIGHKDAIPAAGDSATPNIVLIKIDSLGFDLHTVGVTGIAPTLLTKLKHLCTFFVQHCESQLEPMIAQYGPEIMKESEGVYELIVSEPPAPWIRKHGSP